MSRGWSEMAEPAHPAHDSNRNSTVIATNLRADLKSLLKQDRIRLWDPPYTSVGSRAHTHTHTTHHPKIARSTTTHLSSWTTMKHASTRACNVVPHTIFLICMCSQLHLGLVGLMSCAYTAPEPVLPVLLIGVPRVNKVLSAAS